jgi:NADH-quinone oxidoreductase subunit A
MFVLAMLFAALSFFASSLMSPKRTTLAKRAPYECGIVPTREPPERFPVRFYLVAMTFVVLDVEVIFLFPWALVSDALGTYGLVAMTVFAVPVVVTLAYELSTGSLDWGPTNPTAHAPSSVLAARDAKSVVGRVTSQSIRDSAPTASTTEAAELEPVGEAH